MPDVVRIGNAQAFWGDRNEAAAEMLAREPELDYLTLDYLAEVSMSILAAQRERDGEAGYAADFVGVARSLASYWREGGRCRVVTNAGGLNPLGCARACAAVLEQAGCRKLRIGVVTGDDVLSLLREETPTDNAGAGAGAGTGAGAGAGAGAGLFSNLDTGAGANAVRERFLTANAYLGAAPIVAALSQGAELVITGRVADPSLVVGPCVHHFGWSWDRHDALAGATVAGHLIECGTQVTGGISTDWLTVPDAAHVGFPIVEVANDGSCVVTKPRDTGGRVDEWTVKEQLVYEIGDPGRYLSPDVTASLLSLSVEELGSDRVRVAGARGSAAPATYKVSATYRDGFRAAGSLVVCGRDAVAKARRSGEIVLQRVREAGHTLRDAIVECLGSGECVGPDSEERTACESLETVLRVAVEAESRDAVEHFARQLMPLITAGPQGTTGYAEGRPRVRPVIRYWPCLIECGRLQPRVEVFKTTGPEAGARVVVGKSRVPAADRSQTQHVAATDPPEARVAATEVRLGDIAHARSGDKGTGANIGVVVRAAQWYPVLQRQLTAERVAEFFRERGRGRGREAIRVERFEWTALGALNFVLPGVLARGVRSDAQGKALGQALLELRLVAETPDDSAR